MHVSGVKRKLIEIAVLGIILVVIFNVQRFPDFVEKQYALQLYPSIRNGFLCIFNYIPFSVGDIFYVSLIVAFLIALWQIGRVLMKREFKIAGRYFLTLIVRIQSLTVVFYVFWALNYFRVPAQERLKLNNYDYNETQLLEVASLLIDSANSARAGLKISDLVVSTADIINPALTAISSLSNFDPPQHPIRPSVKPSMLSPMISYLGTAGYYNPFTGEAQFNNDMPVFARPFVACHELAHQMGFGAEDEANFAGFIAGKNSDNQLLKYSAYYVATQEFMNEAWRIDSTAFKTLKGKISEAVLHDFRTEQEYWTRYQGTARQISSVFYDNYLKANKQPGGLKTYNRMIKLTMAYYNKKGLNSAPN